jgi:hypothetical protein
MLRAKSPSAGSRNTSQLSKKDGRKNKGVSRSGAAKTASKKSQRVGKAATKIRDSNRGEASKPKGNTA